MKQPWFSIWVRPKETVRYICETNVNLYIWYIYALAGFSTTLFYVTRYQIDVWLKLLLSLVLAIPVGFIAVAISSCLVYWSGKLIKGSASYSEIRTAILWSYIPKLVSLVLFFLFASVYGFDFVQVLEQNPVGTPVNLWIWSYSIIEGALAIWTLVILLLGISEVQKFSVWMALLNLLIPAIIIIVGSLLLIGLGII